MTTSSGKPPIEEPAIDSSWESPEAASAEEGEDPPIYGVGVPYGGNDHTEEIEPIALDMPFSAEDVMTPPLVTPQQANLRRALTPRPAAATRGSETRGSDTRGSDTRGSETRGSDTRDNELKAPVAQLVLSDLFDSTPPPPGSSMEPPDPAAFSTSRPPPAKGGFFSKRERSDSEPRATGSAWGAARPNADLKYFASGAPAPAGAAGSAARSTPPHASSAPAAARSYPAGAPTRGGFPGGAESGPPVQPVPTAPPVPVTARGAEPITSGGVVALPSINVLAEPPFPRPGSQRPPRASEAPPAAAATPVAATPAAATPVEEQEEPEAVTPRPLSAAAAPEVASSPEVEPEPLTPRPVSSAAAPEVASSPEVEPEPPTPRPVSAHAPPAPEVEPEPKGAPPSEALPPGAEPPGAEPPSAAQPPSRAEPLHPRRSVDTLESVGNARSKRAVAGRGAKARQVPPEDEVARFPSDVPTSRPPDVLLASDRPAEPESQPAARKPRARTSAPPGERRSSNPPPVSALALPPSTKTGQVALPSVMLADDVEAEPDSVALRRAQRAARQTVRIELPEGFGRPGSPLLPGLLGQPGASSALPLPEVPLALRGFPLRRIAPWAVAGLLLFAVCLLLVLRPRSGSLVVTALGSGHRAVESVQIFVDGKALCDSSPCRISGLTPGSHQLRASAPGLSSGAEQVVEILAGEEAAANIELAAAEPDLQAGGVRVAAAERELTLFVDDRRVGKLPQAVSGLPGGKHWIKLDAEDGSPPIEKSVNVLPGEWIDVDAKPAKRDKVVVTIQLSPDSEGASVTFDDAFLLDFPAELELDPRSTHQLSATKPGFEDYALRIDLEDETEKLIEVALTPAEGATTHRPRAKQASAAAAARKAASKSAAGAADATQGLLNISSVPPSQIILNGRPLGSTPKTAVVVPGDSLQTIVFVHPKMGRRRAQKFVPAGKERTVSIRF